MLHAIVSFLASAALIFFAAQVFTTIEVKHFKHALWVAFLIGVIGFLIGWLISGLLHILTLGIPALLGLGFVIRIIANAIVIEIVDKINKGFNTKGFVNSIILAVILAVGGAIVDYLFLSSAV